MRDRLPLVLSATALLVSVLGATPLGTAAYDAVVPPNSIGALELRNGAVTKAKLRGDAVTSGKVLNGSLRAIDFKAGQLPSGPPGPKGDKGGKGDKGTKGDPGLSGYEIVRASVNVPPNTSSRAQAACPAGKKVIGGAGNVQTIPAASPVHTSLTGDDHFNVDFVNTSTVTRQLNAIAICATVAP